MYTLECYNYKMTTIFWLCVLFTCSFGLSYESDCIFHRIVRDPKIKIVTSRNEPFGNTYKLENPQIQNVTKCTWILSTSAHFVLNVLFINSTFSKEPSDSVCNEDYVIVRQRRSGDGVVKAWQPFCGQRELPDIRINGTVEIELNFKSNKSDSKEVSMTVYAEASSTSCGGVYDDNAYGIPISYSPNEFDFTPKNIAHCVWFFKFNTNRSVVVIPYSFRLAIKVNLSCRYYKEFFAIRRWSKDGFVVDIEQCSYIRERLPVILQSKTGDRFALNIHSEYNYRNNEIVKVIYFPTLPGIINEQTINSYVQQKYTFQGAGRLHENIKDGLILVKSKQNTKDRIVMAVHDIKSGCEGALVEAWSMSSGTLQKNKTIISNRSMDSSFVVAAEKALLVYFRFYPTEEATGLQMSYFTTNKICGGILKLMPGQNVSIQSPDDVSGSGYPDKSDCRWAILSETSTKLNISTIILDLEDHTDCKFDYMNIYEGFRHNRTINKKLCDKPMDSAIIMNGDSFFHFHSDSLYSNYQGFHIVIAATKDTNVTRRPSSTTYANPCHPPISTTQLTTTNRRTNSASTQPTKFVSKIPKKSTTPTFPTPKPKVTEKQSKQKSSSSRLKTYLVSSFAAVAGIICAASVAAIIIRRRRRSNVRSETKNDPPGPNHERKRQNSTMPLVQMDDLRKPSASSLDGVILENVHGEAVFAEVENPYYASNSNLPEANKEMKEAINPYYMTSHEEMTQPVYDYADVFENVYAEPKKAVHGEYSYADVQDSCKEVDDKTQNNIHEYEYASTNDCVGNEYEI